MGLLQAQVEPGKDWRVPSLYPRCRRPRCHQPPVADMRRTMHLWNTNRDVGSWYAYCADHLRQYGREVRDGRVWWLG